MSCLSLGLPQVVLVLAVLATFAAADETPHSNIELSGATYPSELPACEGSSLVPLLCGEDRPVHVAPIYWEHEGNAAMRWGNWKLVREYEKPWELYDMAADRTEMNNLVNTFPDKRDEMVDLWQQWATAHQVAFPKRFNMYEWLKKNNK